jgi:hypothetical protein
MLKVVLPNVVFTEPCLFIFCYAECRFRLNVVMLRVVRLLGPNAIKLFTSVIYKCS